MAEFRLALGGSINVVTPEEMNSALTGLQGNILSRMPRDAEKAIRRTSTGSAALNMGTGDKAVIPLAVSKPPMGRIWTLTRVSIVGSDDHTTLASIIGALYVGDAANPMLSQVVIPNITVPYFNTFSRNSIWIHDTEEIFLQVTATGGVGSKILYTVEVSEMWDSSADQQYA